MRAVTTRLPPGIISIGSALYPSRVSNSRSGSAELPSVAPGGVCFSSNNTNPLPFGAAKSVGGSLAFLMSRARQAVIRPSTTLIIPPARGMTFGFPSRFGSDRNIQSTSRYVIRLMAYSRVCPPSVILNRRPANAIVGGIFGSSIRACPSSCQLVIVQVPASRGKAV